LITTMNYTVVELNPVCGITVS